MHKSYAKTRWTKGLTVAVVLPSVLTFCLFVIVFFTIIIPSFRTCLHERKKVTIQMLVEASIGVCTHYRTLEKRGLLSRHAAQKIAVEVLRSMRYGGRQKDYFWISDLQSKMVMHPYRNELEGTDVSKFKDANDKLVFVRLAEIAKNKGEGYSDYLWQWKDDPSRIEPKLSYVKLFEPWSWVIGTGVYTEDVNREISLFTSTVTRAAIGILLIVSLLLSAVVYVGIQNIKARECAECALKNSEEKFRALAENSVDTIMRFDRELRHIYVNPAVLKDTGIPAEAFIGKTHREMGFPETLVAKWEEAIRSVFETREMCRIEFVLPLRNWIDWLLVPEFDEQKEVKAVIGTARDITEMKRAQEDKEKLERQLHQSQKMDALGTLAGGIAHDFNNRLSVIRGHAELALDEVADDSDIREDLMCIVLAAERSRDLVSQILDFSRRKESVKTSIDALQIVRESVKILRSSIPSTVSIDLDAEEEQIFINANAGQLQQVLINLGTNAAYAMRDKHGRLDIVASIAQLDETASSTVAGVSPGTYFCLKMRDEGCGFSAELVDRIFEPFFTTKPLTEGAGLGLAVVHGIVKDHGGGIRVESELNKGSTFTVYLPKTKVDVAGEQPRVNVVEVKGYESILFVDDEAELLSVCDRMLTSLGYTVRTALEGASAYELLEKNPRAFDLVITDETMPKLTGIQLAKKLNEIAPKLPIILCTGNPNRLDAVALSRIGIKDILIKPYNRIEMGGAIRRVLNSAKSDGVV